MAKPRSGGGKPPGKGLNQEPEIADQFFLIPEDSGSGLTVGTVVATDPDGDALS